MFLIKKSINSSWSKLTYVQICMSPIPSCMIICTCTIEFILLHRLTLVVLKYVTGPANIDHVNTNYTELYFVNIFCSECSSYLISVSFRWKPMKFCSSDQRSCCSSINGYQVMIEQRWTKLVIFCAQMVDICRPGHIYGSCRLIHLSLLMTNCHC